MIFLHRFHVEPEAWVNNYLVLLCLRTRKDGQETGGVYFLPKYGSGPRDQSIRQKHSVDCTENNKFLSVHLLTPPGEEK